MPLRLLLPLPQSCSAECESDSQSHSATFLHEVGLTLHAVPGLLTGWLKPFGVPASAKEQLLDAQIIREELQRPRNEFPFLWPLNSS